MGPAKSLSVVFLDEPTTGLDPSARRQVWNYIETVKKAKHPKTILLITHSMEEADMLSSRIGILVNGSMEALGTPQQLKSKFGGGLIVEAKITNSATAASASFNADNGDEDRLRTTLQTALGDDGKVEVQRVSNFAGGKFVVLSVRPNGTNGNGSASDSAKKRKKTKTNGRNFFISQSIYDVLLVLSKFIMPLEETRRRWPRFLKFWRPSPRRKKTAARCLTWFCLTSRLAKPIWRTYLCCLLKSKSVTLL